VNNLVIPPKDKISGISNKTENTTKSTVSKTAA
jgi:hypothetical protein